MSSSETSPSEWPWKDLRKSVRVVVTPLSDYAFTPTKSNTCNIGLGLYSPYVYEIEPFRTIQICTDLLVKLPTGVTGKILARGEGSLFHVVADSIPSNFEKVVEISVKNPIDKRVSIPRACKIARIIPQTYHQPEIYVKPLQPRMPTTPDVHVVAPPPYGHQQVLRTSSTDGQMQGVHPAVPQGQQPTANVPVAAKIQDQGCQQSGQWSQVPSTQQVAVMSLQGNQGNQVEGNLPLASNMLVHQATVTQQNEQGVVTVVSPLLQFSIQQQ